jgi:hypothetical protein
MLREGLRDNAEGIIARGQNRQEADTLVNRLAEFVQCYVVEDRYVKMPQ